MTPLLAARHRRARLARAPRTPRTSNCSTCPTTRRASSTAKSTPRSPPNGRRRPATTCAVQASHGGSGKQARAVIDGLEADVVTLALAVRHRCDRREGQAAAARLADAPAVQQRALHLDHRAPGAQGQSEGHPRLERPGQAGRRGDHAEPEDLRRRALEPPRGLGLRAARRTAATRPRRRTSSRALYRNVPVLDTGARGSTTTFAQRGIGDVLLAWENEAFLAIEAARPGPVRDRGAVAVASWPSRRWRWSTATSIARARARWPRPICDFLYTPAGQKLAAKHYYRPREPQHARPGRRRALPASSNW